MEEESRAEPLTVLLGNGVPQGDAEGEDEVVSLIVRVPASLALCVNDEDTEMVDNEVSDTEKSPDCDTERVSVTLADPEGAVDAVPPSPNVALGDEEREGRAALCVITDDGLSDEIWDGKAVGVPDGDNSGEWDFSSAASLAAAVGLSMRLPNPLSDGSELDVSVAAREILPASLRESDGEATVDFDAEYSAVALGLREGLIDAELLCDPAADALASTPDCELFGVCETLGESVPDRVFDSRDDMLDEKAAESEEDARVEGEED